MYSDFSLKNVLNSTTIFVACNSDFEILAAPQIVVLIVLIVEGCRVVVRPKISVSDVLGWLDLASIFSRFRV